MTEKEYESIPRDIGSLSILISVTVQVKSAWHIL
jgi:hypothetical protein